MKNPETPTAESAASRITTSCDRLFEALADLEAVGGMSALHAVMIAAAVHRLAGLMKDARGSIDESLLAYKRAKADRAPSVSLRDRARAVASKGGDQL